MRVIIIPCSGRKRHGGDSSPMSHVRVALRSERWTWLCEARSALADRLGLAPGPDLGNASSGSAALAPAWQRYDGNLYRKAQLTEVDLCRNDVVILIVSALFGVISADDTIRHYNVAMTDRLPDGTKVNKYWSAKGLAFIVAEMLANIGAHHVHDVLSGAYREAVKGLDTKIPAGCEYQVQTYPGLGTGSDYHRGTDVRKLLATRSNA